MMNAQLFTDAYERGFSSTVRYLVSRGASGEEAEEMAQSAWARGWEAREQLQNQERVVQWVNSIAFRKYCNEKRRSRRLTELCEIPDTSKGPASSATKLDVQLLISRCSKLDRSLLLHRFVGFTTQQIACLHGISEIATRVRIHRSRKMMREQASLTSLKAA